MLLQWLRQQQKPSQIHVSPLKWKMFMCVERWDEVWCWCFMQRNQNWTHSTSPFLCIAHGAFGRFILRAAFELPLSASQFIESIFFFAQSTLIRTKHPTLFKQFFSLSAKWFMSCFMAFVVTIAASDQLCQTASLRWNFLPLSFCLRVCLCRMLSVLCVWH